MPELSTGDLGRCESICGTRVHPTHQSHASYAVRMTARSKAALAALAVLALCAACTQDRHSLPARLPTDVPFAYHLQTEPGGDGALLEGTLDLQDGCLVVLPSWEGFDEELPPVVPVLPIAVTSWDGTTLEVNGESSAVGDSISLGGGYRQVEGDWFVPEGCPPISEQPDEANYFGVGVFS